MNTLPIKLNFFKRAEQFLELNRLDNQYELSMKKWDSTEMEKSSPSSGVNINLSIWNIEKKILYWTYLNHKHLGSPITVDHLKDSNFQKDIKVKNEEICFAGLPETLDNVVAHGFAKGSSREGILFNSDGLLAGSLLFESYKFSKPSCNYYDFELTPIFHKKIGYVLTYLAAWIIIFEVALFLSLQLIAISGLLNNLKLFLPRILAWPLIVASFSPAILLFFGIILIHIKRNET